MNFPHPLQKIITVHEISESQLAELWGKVPENVKLNPAGVSKKPYMQITWGVPKSLYETPHPHK